MYCDNSLCSYVQLIFLLYKTNHKKCHFTKRNVDLQFVYPQWYRPKKKKNPVCSLQMEMSMTKITQESLNFCREQEQRMEGSQPSFQLQRSQHENTTPPPPHHRSGGSLNSSQLKCPCLSHTVTASLKCHTVTFHTIGHAPHSYSTVPPPHKMADRG